MRLPLRDPRAIHLLKTLHKSTNDSFDSGVLGGKCGRGVIRSVRTLGLELELVLTDDPPPRMPVCLGVGFVRPIQLRRILRDAANFGVERVAVFGTDLGDKSYLQSTLLEDGGAVAAMVEGAMEARDTVLPCVRRFGSVDEWVEGLGAAAGARIALDNVRPADMFSHAVSSVSVLAVGSERGWSDRERVLLESAGFARISLGPRALRTETACIAALGICHAGIAQVNAAC